MSVVHKCDRCGAIYEPYELATTHDAGTYVINMGEKTESDGSVTPRLSYELCYSCACEFLCFLQEGTMPREKRHYRKSVVLAQEVEQAARVAYACEKNNERAVRAREGRARVHEQYMSDNIKVGHGGQKLEPLSFDELQEIVSSSS